MIQVILPLNRDHKSHFFKEYDPENVRPEMIL